MAAEQHAAQAPARDAVAQPSTGTRVYATFLLALVFMLAATDRNVLAVLLVPIQAELRVSDTAMGALTGAAFSIVYATAALPLAGLVDRGNRRNLLAVAVALWSLMTALSGFAGSYATLLLARVGVAVGEAAHAPASLSMVGDLHPPRRRGLAVGGISIGTAIGIGVGALIAGLLNDTYGWRVAFFVMGLPGLIVAVLLALTLREPARGVFDAPTQVSAQRSVWADLRYLAAIPTFRALVVAQILLQGGIQSFTAWAPAYFMRIHGLTAAQMSAGFGISVSVASMLAMGAAGAWSDRLSLRGERRRALFCAVAAAVGAPLTAFTALASTSNLAFLGLFLQVFATGGASATCLALGLAVVPAERRGIMGAVMTFCVAVIGGGLGPLAVGMLNDLLRPTYGLGAIRFSLLIAPGLLGLSAVAFWVASRTTDRDAAAVA